MKNVIILIAVFSFFLWPLDADAQMFRRYVPPQQTKGKPAQPKAASVAIEIKEPVVSHDAVETTETDFMLHDMPSPIEPPLADDEYVLYGLFGRNAGGYIQGGCPPGGCVPGQTVQPGQSIDAQKIPGATRPTPEGNPIEKAAIETQRAAITPQPVPAITTPTLPPIIPAATQIIQPIATATIAGRIQNHVTEWLKLLGSVIFLIVAIVYVFRATWRWTLFRCGLVKRWFELFLPTKAKTARKPTTKKTPAKKKK